MSAQAGKNNKTQNRKILDTILIILILLLTAFWIVYGIQHIEFNQQGVITVLEDDVKQHIEEKQHIQIPEDAIFLKGAYIGWQDISTVYLFEMDISSELVGKDRDQVDDILHELFVMGSGWKERSGEAKEHLWEWGFPIEIGTYENEWRGPECRLQYTLLEDGILHFCLLVFS